MAEPYYLTTAIHYPNGKPHIGHAYETIAADVVARFQRLRGREVRFQTGTDEHGLKMAQKARDLGKTPRELADEMSGHFKDLFDALNISYDRFTSNVNGPPVTGCPCRISGKYTVFARPFTSISTCSIIRSAIAGNFRFTVNSASPLTLDKSIPNSSFRPIGSVEIYSNALTKGPVSGIFKSATPLPPSIIFRKTSSAL